MSNVHNDNEHSVDRSNRKIAPVFRLSGLACDVLDGNALSGINRHAGRQRSNLRHIQYADKVVVDVKLLRPVFPCALGVMDNDLFIKYMEGMAWMR